MRTLLTFATLTLSVSAFAAPAVHDEGARVAVTLPGAHAAGAPEAHGDAIEVPLAGSVTAEKLTIDDATIKRVDILAGAQPRMVIRVKHSRQTTQKLAAAAIVREANGELRVAMPREASAAVPLHNPVVAPAPVAVAEAPAVEAPKPAKSHAVEAAPAAPAAMGAKPAAVEAKAAAAKPAAVEPKSAVAAAVDAKLAALDDGAPPPKSSKPAEAFSDLLAEAPAKRSSLPLPYVIVALLCAVPLIVMARKKRKGAAPVAPSLKVLASQSLGGRSRLVLVESEHQHILLAVNDANTRVVARYDAADAVSPAEAVAKAALEAADDAESDEQAEEAELDLPPARKSASSSAFAKIAAAARMAADARAAADAAEAAAAANPMLPPAPAPRAAKPSLRSVPNSAVAGLLKLRNGGDAATPAAATDGPSEWGEALRKAAAQRSKR